MLQLTDIEKQYRSGDPSPDFTLSVPELTVGRGEFFALLGPSGCGKTTLLKVVAGLIPAEGGRVWFDGREWTDLPPEKRGFGMVFQEPLLFPHMTVKENVAFGLKMRGWGKKKRELRAGEWLDSVGLDGLESRLPSELSGGQQQRVSLARAMAIQPRVLLMDEPFSALDPQLREKMRVLLKQLHQEHQMTILFVTHDREEAFYLADRIGILTEGRLLQADRPRNLYEKPSHPEVARFLGLRNVIAGRMEQSRFHSAEIQLPMEGARPGKGWLVLYPECFRLNPSKSDSSTIPFRVTIREVIFRTGYYSIQAEVGNLALNIRERPTLKPPRPGEQRTAFYPVSKLHWIPEEKGGE
ncbi:putative spermidine/putrescine transport system ATP-binding protein/thiamine transport system ATP-binding protein [Melghirimyces profundicolus]|uniref:Carnitine transport ATP-binding protein OpuCA n=1 Tax=Melghirimyces profundicolus TaxID=1242148 RepID=A0A2T6C8T4_9BACL|nr:ABC transporter ATP-binding protein [Melghirimyces profundicolus]PTX64720.1 putative spermidine/putrescine transport system ATP-binding protein/thiamine transport system ATP-binding protein [Melghirimyces profundicolus]